MKFTLSWLKDHLETTATLAEITDALTRVGLEVESIDDPAAKLAAFTIARVLEARPHPNADRLRVCMIETGAGAPVQVVCGAPNARAGMTSVFSPPGTYIPGKDITLGKGVIRGVESNGMLCSAAELMISDDHDGIIDLPNYAPLGEPYARWAGLDDAVFDISVTPNRPDAASVRGVARDLAAAGLGRLRERVVPPALSDTVYPGAVTLDLGPWERNLCPAFAIRRIEGVTNGPSPDWMQKRLRAVGLRPISALVDITNYITFDRGRPLHVFDAAKVRGDLVVRRAKAGESLLALDGRTYALDEEMIVIADEAGVESIAGIMGGQASGCDEATTSVLIESALWDPLNIAQTGRRLGVNSDARYRFERGVDPAFMISGAELATAMVLEFCGGTPTALHVAGMLTENERVIDFPWTEVKRLTGLALPVPEMRATLSALGFWVSGSGDRVKIAPPSWRPDVHGKADIVEEIVRIAGLDRVASTPFPRLGPREGATLTLLQKRTRTATRALAARGLMEAVTWSFIAHEAALAFGGGAPELVLANPIAADLSDMRPSLLPGLLAAAQRNVDRGFSDLALFEVGQIFTGDEPEGQRVAAAALRRGLAGVESFGRHWAGKAGAADLFDAKADAMALLGALGVPTGGLQVAAGGPPWMHPGRSATLRFGPNGVIGAFGELHPRVLESLGVDGPVAACEITLDGLPAPKTRPTKIRPKLELPDLQPVRRDFAFVMDQSVRAEDLLARMRGVDRRLVMNVSLFDVYEGANVGPGRKSLAVEVTLQPREKTLTDADLEALSLKLVEAAEKAGAVLRR